MGGAEGELVSSQTDTENKQKQFATNMLCLGALVRTLAENELAALLAI